MSENVTINGTTYPAVDTVVLYNANGNAIPFYPDAVRYSAQDLTEAQKAQARKNIGMSNISLGYHTDGLVYLFIDSKPVGSGIELATGGISGYVDSDNNIVINGLSDGTYTVKYEMEDGSTIDIGDLVLDTNVYYSVTNNLTNCVSNNSATQTVQGDSYSATITANSGYELESVTVTMGGSPVTVSGGTISIASVTGNIVITASATETVVAPAYTNLLPRAVDTDGSPYNGGKGYKSGYKMSTSSGNESTTTGAYCSGFIPIDDVYKVIRIKNITLSNTANVNNFTFYNAGKSKIGAGVANGTAGAFQSYVTVKDGVYSCQPMHWVAADAGIAFFRFSCGGISDETIVTVNEEIV